MARYRNKDFQSLRFRDKILFTPQTGLLPDFVTSESLKCLIWTQRGTVFGHNTQVSSHVL